VAPEIFGITPAVAKSMGSYEQSPEPKYLVEFEGAAHFAWTDLGWTAHDRIVAYSLAFMEHYAKGEAARYVLTRILSGVAEARYRSELGTEGSATKRHWDVLRPEPVPLTGDPGEGSMFAIDPSVIKPASKSTSRRGKVVA
jgi:hypothetical protein